MYIGVVNHRYRTNEGLIKDWIYEVLYLCCLII